MKFIRLTDLYGAEPVYVNMNNVSEMIQFDGHAQLHYVGGEKDLITVKETCEEIMKLIENNV